MDVAAGPVNSASGTVVNVIYDNADCEALLPGKNPPPYCIVVSFAGNIKQRSTENFIHLFVKQRELNNITHQTLHSFQTASSDCKRRRHSCLKTTHSWSHFRCRQRQHGRVWYILLACACALHHRWHILDWVSEQFLKSTSAQYRHIMEMLVASQKMTQVSARIVPHSRVDWLVNIIGTVSEVRNASEIWNCAVKMLALSVIRNILETSHLTVAAPTRLFILDPSV